MRRAAIIGAALLLLAARPAWAEPTGLQVRVGDRTIHATLYRPTGPGPFPLVVLSHGSPPDPSRRDTMGANAMRRQALALAGIGAAVLVPLRRGYGGQGEWAEGFGTCSAPDFASAGLRSAEDIRAALAAAVAQPGIDGTRIALIGHSAGGWGSVAAATQTRVLGVVNLAGGRGSSCMSRPDAQRALVTAAARYGTRSRVPELWIYSRNDRSFEPALVSRLHGAFVSAGGSAELVEVAAYGDDGHFFIRDTPSWLPRVDAFLRRIGILR